MPSSEPPPFMRGTKIQTNISEEYLRYLLTIRDGINGNADLCAHFLRTASEQVKPSGVIGILATNTITQGDTREGGLEFIVKKGGTIYRATSSIPWPGTAAVVISKLWIIQRQWDGSIVLDEKLEEGIDAFLTPARKDTHAPFHLKSAPCSYHNGSFLNGLGFILNAGEASALLRLPNYDVVIRPYIGGKDTYTRPDPNLTDRFIIYFGQMNLQEAQNWPEALLILKERVWPERSIHKTKQLREKWWQFKRPTPELYRECLGQQRVIVKTQVSNTYAFVFVNSEMVFDQRLIVFPDERSSVFAILQSIFHEVWAQRYAATLKEDMSYTPSDYFKTFPFPIEMDDLESIGAEYHKHRSSLMSQYVEGLTRVYQRYHKATDTSEMVSRLRDLQVEMDAAVARAYGWSDLELAHDFHQTKQDVRYTISEAVRREVLDRLLQLNHERYVEEVAAGLHDKGAKKKTKTVKTKKAKSKAPPTQQTSLIDM